MIKNTNKAFTLIELIVVIAIIAVLVLLAIPKMNNYQKEARLTNIKNNIKVLEGAAERYYLDNQKWPRNSIKEPYTKEQIIQFANEILSLTGKQIEIDENGKYYPIDYNLLGNYVQKPKDGIQYIIQNPVGNVYYLDKLTKEGKEEFGIKDKNKDNPDEPSEPGDNPDGELGKVIVGQSCGNDSNIVFSGMPIEAFDNDETTTYSSQAAHKVTWTGDITNRAIVVDFTTESGVYIQVHDENGNPLYFNANGTYTTNFYVATAFNGIFNVPSNAKSIAFGSSVRGAQYKDIHIVDDKVCPNTVSDTAIVPRKTSALLTWVNPSDEDFDRVYVFREGIKIGESTTNSFEDLTGLLANEKYTYTLQVRDKSGNLSAPSTIKTKTLQRETYWSGLDPQAFDFNDATKVSINTSKKVYWTGDLTNKSVYLNVQVPSLSLDASMNIMDANGNPLSFFDINGTQMKGITIEDGTSLKTYFTMPENAAYIQFNVSGQISSLQVNDIHLAEDIVQPKSILNLEAIAKEAAVKLQWTNPEEADFKKFLVLRDGVKIGETTTNEFEDLTGLLPNSDYTYRVLVLDTSGNLSIPTDITVKTLESQTYWSGLDSQAFDKNDSTTVTLKGKTSYKVYWTGDLTNKSIYFKGKAQQNDVTLVIKDANGNDLYFFDSNGVYTNVLTIAENATLQKNFAMPANAAYIQINVTTSSTTTLTLYDMHLESDATNPNPIQSLTITPRETSAKLQWINPTDDDFKKVLISRNNVKIGETTANEFEDLTGIWPNTEYTYQVQVIDNVGNLSEVKEIKVKTLESEVYWSGLEAQAFDKIDSSSVSLKGKATYNVYWTGDLTNKSIYFNGASRNNDVSIYIKDANGNNLTFLDSKGTSMTALNISKNTSLQVNFIMPENAAYILIDAKYSSSTLVLYDMHLN